MERYITYDEIDEPIVISKSILDLLIKQPNSSDLISLYVFYYYTAKWQKTNQAKANSNYVQKGLDIGGDRFIRAKKKLIELGLIKEIQAKEGGKFSGKYIKIYFIWKKSTVDEKVRRGENTSTAKHGTNALSTNSLNALSTNISTSSLKNEHRADSQLEEELPIDSDGMPVIKGKNLEKHSPKKVIQARNELIEKYKLYCQQELGIQQPLFSKGEQIVVLNIVKEFNLQDLKEYLIWFLTKESDAGKRNPYSLKWIFSYKAFNIYQNFTGKIIRKNDPE